MKIGMVHLSISMARMWIVPLVRVLPLIPTVGVVTIRDVGLDLTDTVLPGVLVETLDIMKILRILTMVRKMLIFLHIIWRNRVVVVCLALVVQWDVQTVRIFGCAPPAHVAGMDAPVRRK